MLCSGSFFIENFYMSEWVAGWMFSLLQLKHKDPDNMIRYQEKIWPCSKHDF